MVWDVAKSLDKLLAQINALAPNRRKDSDGSIGDAAHQAGTSEHNPEDKPGSEPDEVDARDFTHDPRNGCDIGRIFEAIRLSCKAGRERRVKYLIFNRRYCSRNTGWEWARYTGTNPHDKHGHVSVNDLDDDNTAPWEIGAAPTSGGDDMQADERSWLQNAYQGMFFGGNSMGAPVPGKVNAGSAGNALIDLLQHLRRQVDELRALPAGEVTVTADLMRALGDQVLLNVGPLVRAAVEEAIDARVEAAVRRVLGSVDGAVPPV